MNPSVEGPWLYVPPSGVPPQIFSFKTFTFQVNVASLVRPAPAPQVDLMEISCMVFRESVCFLLEIIFILHPKEYLSHE